MRLVLIIALLKRIRHKHSKEVGTNHVPSASMVIVAVGAGVAAGGADDGSARTAI